MERLAYLIFFFAALGYWDNFCYDRGYSGRKRFIGGALVGVAIFALAFMQNWREILEERNPYILLALFFVMALIGGLKSLKLPRWSVISLIDLIKTGRFREPITPAERVEKARQQYDRSEKTHNK